MGEEDLNESYGEDIKPLPKESTVPTEPIEFDGTTVLCRVCGDKASGFHYGVHSCEGCKGFFRRSIQQKIQYRPCTKNQQCSILRINRNRCQYCRLKKCIAVGMSRDAVRFGRVPKREKAKILAAMQKNNASSQEKALNAAIEDDFKLMTTIIMAHEDTSEFTSDKVASFVEQARSHPVYSQCSPHGACPLNPAPHIMDNDSLPGLESAKEFSKRFAPAIKGVVEFAKRIPGFQLLVTDDQVTLLKAGVFEVLLVRLAGMFDSQTNSLICLNGQVLRRDSLHHTSNARFLLDSMFDFAERMNGLHLSDSEIALFCAVVILSPDRPGLRSSDLVSKMWQKITGFLQKSIAKSHPDNPGVFSELMKKIPDLRTLNTLHSEKLLAYKTEEPIVREMTVSGSIDVITSSSITNENSAYAAISHDIWGNYAILTNQPPLIIHDEDLRCNSPPEVNSSSSSGSSGSSGSDEWSTVDKDEQDLECSPESVNGHCIDDVKSPPRSSSFSNHNGYANEESWVADSNQSVLAYQQHMMKRAAENTVVSPEHNSSSSDEGYYVDSPTKNLVYPKLHRVDSPTDSGIESGKEHGPSPPTISNCSSPPSTVDEKMKDELQRLSNQDKQDHIEDMPVLKRALQAPPLVNTNMLMDEAYRHHKKFRAARREAESPSSPTQMSLASTHSTLVKTLEQAPRYLSEQQLKRTDLIHNIIMQNETLPNHKSPPLHQNSTQIPSQSHHVEALPTTCSSYPFSSVPNQTSPPPPPPSSLTPSGVAQHKSLLLCANGYYVQQQGGSVQSTSIYSSSSTPALWPYSQQHTSPATTVSSATSPPVHVTQFEHPHNIQQSSPVSFCSSPPVVNSSRAGSPRLSPYHRARSPASSTSSLVMNGVVTTALNPVHSTVCGNERAYHSEPSLKSFAESQPLNLSKKLFSPALVKIES